MKVRNTLVSPKSCNSFGWLVGESWEAVACITWLLCFWLCSRPLYTLILLNPLNNPENKGLVVGDWFHKWGKWDLGKSGGLAKVSALLSSKTESPHPSPGGCMALFHICQKPDGAGNATWGLRERPTGRHGDKVRVFHLLNTCPQRHRQEMMAICSLRSPEGLQEKTGTK